MGKVTKGVLKAAKSLKPSEIKENPAKAAGTIVGASVAAAGHPWLAAGAAAGTERLVEKAAPLIRSRVGEFTQGRNF
jgi:hypothetical protein